MSSTRYLTRAVPFVASQPSPARSCSCRESPFELWRRVASGRTPQLVPQLHRTFRDDVSSSCSIITSSLVQALAWPARHTLQQRAEPSSAQPGAVFFPSDRALFLLRTVCLCGLAQPGSALYCSAPVLWTAPPPRLHSDECSRIVRCRGAHAGQGCRCCCSSPCRCSLCAWRRRARQHGGAHG